MEEDPLEDEVQGFLALAAALIPSLVSPGLGLQYWLHEKTSITALNEVVAMIREFAQFGISFQSGDLKGEQGSLGRREQITNLVREAQELKDKARQKRFLFFRSNRIIRRMLASGGELGRIMEIVAGHESENLKELEELLSRWGDKDQVKEQVYRIDALMDLTQKNPIEGTALEQLLRYLISLLEPAYSFRDLVLAEQKIEEEKDWYLKRIDELQHTLSENIPIIYKKLQQIQDQRGDYPPISAAIYSLQRSLERLEILLGLSSEREHEDSQLHDLWWIQGVESLDQALSRRLLWLPSLPLNEEGLPVSTAYSSLIDAISTTPPSQENLFKSIDEWLRRKDFRFLETILDASPYDERRDAMKTKIHTEWEGLKESLREKIATTEEIIERAFINGVITEEEKLDYSEKVSLMDCDQVFYFQPHFEELNGIKERLDMALKGRLQVLKEKWEKHKRGWLSSLGEEDRRQLESFLHESFKNGDSRIIEECLANLQESQERGEPFSLSQFSKESESLFLGYLENLPVLERESRRDPRFTGVKRAIQREKTWAGLQFGRLPASHRRQAQMALDAWINIKKQKKEGIEQKDLESILSFIGFIMEEGPESFKILQNEGVWVHALIKMSASDQARPFPQFGSLTSNQYNVVCLWEKPGADTISSLLHDTRLDVQSLIILYFGFLSNYQKDRLLKMNREKNLVVATMDELLFLYLLDVRNNRLKTFLHSTLPYSCIIPYTPYVAGDVPPELFYGRKEAAIQLQRSEGSCLVYGGRQMGKSALLRHVQRRTHNPGLNQYARVEDIKLLGNPITGESADKLWVKLRDIFVNWGLLEPSPVYEEDEIIQEISRVMTQNSVLKVLIMLDEADEFLNHDSEQGFKIITKIRQLMWDSNRRFKVVFTGLHNVQRFHSLSNQPLPHFGAPLLVGPLKKEAAFNLIAEPLKALGFDLDQAVVLLILSYTNYHPGLIHIFCSELIKRLYSQTGRFRSANMGRVCVTREDVESVYLNEDVRKQIKDRFELTLALDPRYQVIAWSMVADQTSIRDSYARPYTVGEILQQVHYWWEAEFSKMRNNELKGLLDELCGLGVLSLTTDDRYRLRSPNLVRLMGTEQDIEERLLEYAEKPAMKEEHPHSFHLVLDRESGTYSPFTYEQTRNLNTPYADLRIITISKALGEESIASAIKRLGLNLEGGREEYVTEIPPSVMGGDDLISWLEGHMGEEDSIQRVFYHSPGDCMEELEDKIQKGRSFTQKMKREREKALRLYFIMTPPLYWKWLKRGLLFEDLEATGLITAVERWDERAIRQRLNHAFKLDKAEVCETIMEVSGGWPILLDRIMEECGTATDPIPAAKKIEEDLLEGDLKDLFISSLKLPRDKDFWEIFDFILQEGEFLADMIQPQEIADRDLTPIQCRDALLFLQQFHLVNRDGEFYSVERVVERIFA